MGFGGYKMNYNNIRYLIEKRYKNELGDIVGYDIISYDTANIKHKQRIFKTVEQLYCAYNLGIIVENAVPLKNHSDFRAKKGYNIETIVKKETSNTTKKSLKVSYHGQDMIDDCLKIVSYARNNKPICISSKISNDHVIFHIMKAMGYNTLDFIRLYLSNINPYVVKEIRGNLFLVEYALGLALRLTFTNDSLAVEIVKSELNRNYGSDDCAVFVRDKDKYGYYKIFSEINPLCDLIDVPEVKSFISNNVAIMSYDDIFSCNVKSYSMFLMQELKKFNNRIDVFHDKSDSFLSSQLERCLILLDETKTYACNNLNRKILGFIVWYTNNMPEEKLKPVVATIKKRAKSVKNNIALELIIRVAKNRLQ